MILWCDFETRSECDLIARGSYNYCTDLSTDVLCMAYAFDDEDVQLWTPAQPFPERVRAHKGQVRAHNAAFERLIFWYVLHVNFELEQFYCTAAQARSNCAPGSLEDVGRFAGASMKKDHRGAQLVRKCCIPPFKHTEQDMQDLLEYCRQDVRAMRAVSKGMRDLSADELLDYHVNERINDRGVLVDVDLCHAAMRYSEAERVEIEARVVELTEGMVTSVRSPKLRQWVLDRLGPEARKLARSKERDSIDKTVRANLLALAEENPDEIPPAVAEVIQCADDLWASSTAKFSRLAALADSEDQRVRGAFVFAGGAATGRASSYGAQVHNFPRKAAKKPADLRHALVRGHSVVPAFGPRVTDVLKSMLRPALVPAPGKQFVVADWSAIEGRVNPWLAASPAGEKKLDIFRERLDPYKVNAAATYGVQYLDVTDDQRQVGKVQELALGFGGSTGAFSAMGRVYGVRFDEPQARRIVDAWRRANPWAVAFWQELENAYMSAMRHKGHEFSAGRVTYVYDGQHLWYMLPSGRVLCYPFARFEGEHLTYCKAAWKPAADATEWPRARLWSGLACENVTQASAHDILRVNLRQLDAYGLMRTVLHVHDEIVVETDEPDRAKLDLERMMTTPPAWAEGLPLAVEAKVMERYGK
jgi:DNA polymerase bacteriophage-type